MKPKSIQKQIKRVERQLAKVQDQLPYKRRSVKSIKAQKTAGKEPAITVLTLRGRLENKLKTLQNRKQK